MCAFSWRDILNKRCLYVCTFNDIFVKFRRILHNKMQQLQTSNKIENYTVVVYETSNFISIIKILIC